MPRLDEDQRAAILADGAVFDAGDIGLLVGEDPSNRYTRIGDEQIARALRIVAHLDGMSDGQVAELIEHAEWKVEGLHYPPLASECEAWRALARALEEVGR